jgi:electron transfer flavoprotein beta subunit
VRIAVCIKRVPEMDVKFRVAPSGVAIDESGLKFDMGDFDGYALEVGLQLAERDGGEVTVVSLGPASVQETLRKALSMGASRAIHLEAERVPFDNFAVAEALARELAGYDLVLFGKMAGDTASGSVGLMVAELLGIPMVHACSRLEVSNGWLTARREIEGGAEIVRLQLPGAASIDEGIARLRYPSLKGIMAAKKKSLEVRPAALGEERLMVVRMELPPERQGGRIVGTGVAAVPELVRLLQTEAKVL